MVKDGQLIYVELKSGQSDRGPAWITRARVSKSGRTVYFNGRALKSLFGSGVYANYVCMETGDEFWVSGVKVRGGDRHWAGGGPVMVDARVLDDYLRFRGLPALDPATYPVIHDIVDTDVSKLSELENRPGGLR
ncbi:MAG: hypothetical protein ABL998_16125 [Planctomycetota bacterium]